MLDPCIPQKRDPGEMGRWGDGSGSLPWGHFLYPVPLEKVLRIPRESIISSCWLISRAFQPDAIENGLS